MLAAGVTDAATLEPPVPVPARRVEVARATQVALPVWLAVPGAAARPVVGALPVLPTAMRAADVRAAGVLAPAVAGAGSDVLAPAELIEAQLVALSDAAEAAAEAEPVLYIITDARRPPVPPRGKRAEHALHGGLENGRDGLRRRTQSTSTARARVGT